MAQCNQALQGMYLDSPYLDSLDKCLQDKHHWLCYSVGRLALLRPLCLSFGTSQVNKNCWLLLHGCMASQSAAEGSLQTVRLSHNVVYLMELPHHLAVRCSDWPYWSSALRLAGFLPPQAHSPALQFRASDKMQPVESQNGYLMLVARSVECLCLH